MIRTALRPGWLVLLALLVAVVVGFYQLGMWQIGVSSNEASRERAAAQAARPTEPLGEVMGPQQVFPEDGAGLSVAAEGRYAADLQFLVPGRMLEGEPGFWVVTPVLTQASGEPALLPVVRGFVADAGEADAPAQDPVRVTGTLAPSESPGEVGALGELAEGQLPAVDTADLVNLWDEPVYNAFIFLVEEDPATSAPAVQRIPPPVFGDSGIVWRNFGYGLQWFVFAGFAVYMYVRFLRQATYGTPDPAPAARRTRPPRRPRPTRPRPEERSACPPAPSSRSSA